jgi:hypothetical protein
MTKRFKIGLLLLILGVAICLYYYVVWSNTMYACAEGGCGDISFLHEYLPMVCVGISIAMTGVGIMVYDIISRHLASRKN